MAFQNRQAEHLNRKKLTVIDLVKDSSGNIISLIVDSERAEGNVITEGTALTAENLNYEIRQAVNEIIPSIGNTAVTQKTYDSSTKIVTTEFVWNVLVSLGLANVDNSGSSSGSSGSSSVGSGT